MPAVVNQTVTHIWQIRDAAGTPQSGLAAGMTYTLTRYPGAVPAAETITITEIGATGDYQIVYTPVTSDLYRGVISEPTLFLEYNFEDDVADEQPAPDNFAYCAISEVVAYAQMGSYSAGTIPTDTQVLGFMAKRASQVYAALALVMGTAAPGPTGFALTIDTSSDAGLALSYACAQANALGAAMDALEAAGTNQAPAQSERVAELGRAFAGALKMLEFAALVYQGFATRAATHLSQGEMTARTITPRQEFLAFDERTSW